MALTSDLGKANTILDLTHAIGEGLTALQDSLDSRFYRAQSTEGKCETTPILPNILDEILQGLNANNKHLLELIEFISIKVLPKIS